MSLRSFLSASVSVRVYPADTMLVTERSADTVWVFDTYPKLTELPIFVDPCQKAVFLACADTQHAQRLGLKLELLRRLATTYGTAHLMVYSVRDPSQDLFHLTELLEPYCKEIRWLSDKIN